MYSWSAKPIQCHTFPRDLSFFHTLLTATRGLGVIGYDLGLTLDSEEISILQMRTALQYSFLQLPRVVILMGLGELLFSQQEPIVSDLFCFEVQHICWKYC